MAQNTPIVVKIIDDTGAETIKGASGGTGEAKAGLSNNATKSNDKQSTFAAAGTYVAMQSFNYITSNVGKFTGSQHTQTQINNAKRLVSYGMAFMADPVLGLAVIAMDGATSVTNRLRDMKLDQIRSDQAKARNGDLGGYRR